MEKRNYETRRRQVRTPLVVKKLEKAAAESSLPSLLES